MIPTLGAFWPLLLTPLHIPKMTIHLQIISIGSRRIIIKTDVQLARNLTRVNVTESSDVAEVA